jgi:hypothetical protein
MTLLSPCWAVKLTRIAWRTMHGAASKTLKDLVVDAPLCSQKKQRQNHPMSGRELTAVLA